MADILYLIKANRVRGYHQQNLAILAAPDGDRVDIVYALRWVQPGIDVGSGQACMLVFADSPYLHFLPIRWGRVVAAERTDAELRLTVRLGAFVVDGERLTREWDATAQIDAERGDGERTRPYFVFREPAHGARNPRSAEEADEAWRAAVAGLGANEWFAGASVARLREIRRTDGEVVAPGAAVPAGAELVVAVEVVSIRRRDKVLQATVETDPAGAVEVVAGADLGAQGVSEITLRTVDAGSVRCRIELLPDALRSSRPTFDLEVLPAPPETAESIVDGIGPGVDGVRRLVRRLQRDATMTDEAWAALYRDVLVPWAPGDHEVICGFAEALHAVGADRELETVLATVDRRSPRLDLLLLLASLVNGTAADRLDLLARVDLDDPDNLAAVMDALGEAPAQVLGAVAAPLVDTILGERPKLELIERVITRVPSDDMALAFADELAKHSGELATDRCLARWPDPRTTPDAALARIVAWGAGDERAVAHVHRHVRRLVDAGRLDDAVAQLPAARDALPMARRASADAVVARALIDAATTDAPTLGRSVDGDPTGGVADSGSAATHQPTLLDVASTAEGSDEQPGPAGRVDGVALAADALEEALRLGDLAAADELAGLLAGSLALAAAGARPLAPGIEPVVRRLVAATRAALSPTGETPQHDS